MNQQDTGALPLASRSQVPEQIAERAYAIPLRVVLEVPVVGFTVRSLIDLAPGCILETDAQHNDDLPVCANGQRIGMAKFDVTGDLLAVRLTGIA